MEQITYAEWLRYIAGKPLASYAQRGSVAEDSIYLCCFLHYFSSQPPKHAARLMRRIGKVLERQGARGKSPNRLDIPATLSSKRAWLLSEADRADRYTNSRKGKA